MVDLVPTREQDELARTVRDLLAKRSDSAAVRAAMESADGFDRDLWSTLCEQIGAAALAVPEEFGGAGFTIAETWLVLEQLGWSLAPTPLLASVVAAGALAATGAADASESVAAGTLATLVQADVEWDGTSLSGSVSPVQWGAQAEILLIAIPFGGKTALVQVDPAAAGVTRTSLTPLDPTTPFARIDFDGAAAQVLSADAGDAVAAAERVGLLVNTALQVGCAQRGLDLTVAYTKEREQFGRAIGSFQALKHRMADLHVLVQMSRSGAWAAVQAHIDGSADSDRLAASAGSYCAEAAVTIGGETVQLHGGIGITWEHDSHLILKRARVLHDAFGAPHRIRESLVPAS